MRAWPVLLTLIAALPSITGDTNSRRLSSTLGNSASLPNNQFYITTDKEKSQTLELKTKTKSATTMSSKTKIHADENTLTKDNEYQLPASQRLLQEQAITTRQSEELDKKQVVAQLEKSLLSLFGMQNRPKRKNSPIIVPPAMKKLYEEAMKARSERIASDNDFGGLGARKGLHASTANTVRSFTHTDSPIDSRFTGKHRFRLSFNVSSIPLGESLKAAELSLFHKHSGQNQRVLVYDLVRPGIKGKREPLLRLVDSKLLTAKTGEQVSLDVYPAVERWIEQPSENHGLIVHVSSKEEHGLRLRRSTESDENQPTLLTYTDDGRGDSNINMRQKRAASSQRRSHRRKNSQEICQRRPLYVDFSDVGWTDWIVAPPGYDAYYCYGDCPFPLGEHLNSTNHAIVQNLVNSVNPSAVPKACCVPTQLSAISMLYLDEENKVVLKNYQDMSVVGCGCR